MPAAKFVAALILGALALVAVVYISDDTTNVMAEATAEFSTDGMALELPEDEDSFVAVAMSAAKKSKFDPFHVYKWTMEEAEKKAPADKLQAAKQQCRLLRTGSYKTCGTYYCGAKKNCGTPCVEKYRSPPMQIVPLVEGTGKEFYHVHEVDVKEVHAKEKRSKEVATKELASKERTKKERVYKVKVAKEKQAKEAAKMERVTKEKSFKNKQAKERKHKELNEKKKENAHKAQVLLKCVDGADKVESKCETDKAAELQQKARDAEATAKTEAKTAEKAQKKETADAAAYASASHASGYTSASNQAYASALAVEHVAVAKDEATYASAAQQAAYLSSESETEDEEAKMSTAAYASQQMVSQTYDAKIVAYTSAIVADGQTLEATTLPPPALDPEEAAANDKAMAYAAEVIPAGGQRRLLMASGTTPFDASKALDEVKDLVSTIAKDKKKQGADRVATAVQVNVTDMADEVRGTAENTFNTAHNDEQDADNRARMHAGKAQLGESKVTATDSYVSTHRGVLHQKNCQDEKKFSFDVCFGRATYKGQLYQTKQAKEARDSADKYKKVMAKDYAIVLEDTKKLKTQQATLAKQETQVHGDTAKLDNDSRRKAKVLGEIREEKAAKAAKNAQEKKGKAEEQAKAAMGGTTATATAAAPATATATATAAAPATATATATGSAALFQAQDSLYQMEGDLYAELVQDEDEGEEDFEEATEEAPFGRRLLSQKKTSKTCKKITHKAFGSCKTVVNDAYAGCTRLYQKAMGQ